MALEHPSYTDLDVYKRQTVALELLIASPRVSAIGVGHLSESTYDCEARTELSQIVLRTKFGTLIRCT